MSNKRFETVAAAQRRAKRRLPPSVYGALVAGAEAGVTVRDNVAAFFELGSPRAWPGSADVRTNLNRLEYDHLSQSLHGSVCEV